MSSFTFTKNVADSNTFSRYIKNNLNTLSSVIADTTTVKLAFSTALSAGEQATLTALVTAYADSTDEDLDLAGLNSSNSTTTALSANGVFTGIWEDVSRYTGIRVSCLSNVSSATLGLVLQFGIASKQADLSRSYTFTAGTALSETAHVAGRYFRVVYTNGASAQASFSLAALWSMQPSINYVQAADSLLDQTDCAVTRSIVAGRNDYQQYTNARTDEQGMLRVREKRAFDRLLTVDQYPWIQVSFTYGLNVDSTNITGSVTSANSCALVSTTAAANTSATLTTDKYCICSPGNSTLILCAAAFTAGVAGSTQVIGAGDLVNGLFWGYNGTAFGVAVRSNSVTTWVPQTSFNVDTLQGTGSSGVTLVPAAGNTYAIAYDAMGFGSATFMLRRPTAGGGRGLSLEDFITVHHMSFGNVSASVGVRNPQFPCTAIATNTTNATAVIITVASFCVYVDEVVPRRSLNTVDVYKAVVTTASAPVFAILNKTTFGTPTAVINCATVFLKKMTVAQQNGSRNLVLTLVRNATLGNMGTYTDTSTSSCVSYSASATGTYTAASGDALFTACTYGDHDSYDLSDLGIYLSPGATLAVLGKVSTLGTVNVTIGLTWAELQ